MDVLPDHPPAEQSGDRLWRDFETVRVASVRLTETLSAEDQGLQSMPDASPTKWHLAHTTWFFETLILRAMVPGYRCFDERFAYLFNSYYESLGPRHPRPQRGVLSRPSLEDVWRYRAHVDRAMQDLIATAESAAMRALGPLVTLGLQHEQQHQELILTDIKHAFAQNPMFPTFCDGAEAVRREPVPMRWIEYAGGLVDVGDAGVGFAFDNERPRHRVHLVPYALASRPVTCGEFLEFIDADGYRRPDLWLADGWAAVQARGWTAPGYWIERDDDGFDVFTLHGLRRLDPAEPVCHLSYYEAAAYAQWREARLPSEFEWEAAVGNMAPGHRFDRGALHPIAAHGTAAGLDQAFGEVWEWTASAYAPYPGFRPLSGVASEYNGKFMVNQLVLRGGSCVTPRGHLRASYRNFFPADARWQFSGVRLARDAS